MGGGVFNLLVLILMLLYIEIDKSSFFLVKLGREFGFESEIRFLRLSYFYIVE